MKLLPCSCPNMNPTKTMQDRSPSWFVRCKRVKARCVAAALSAPPRTFWFHLFKLGPAHLPSHLRVVRDLVFCRGLWVLLEVIFCRVMTFKQPQLSEHGAHGAGCMGHSHTLHIACCHVLRRTSASSALQRPKPERSLGHHCLWAQAPQTDAFRLKCARNVVRCSMVACERTMPAKAQPIVLAVHQAAF